MEVVRASERDGQEVTDLRFDQNVAVVGDGLLGEVGVGRSGGEISSSRYTLTALS